MSETGRPRTRGAPAVPAMDQTVRSGSIAAVPERCARASPVWKCGAEDCSSPSIAYTLRLRMGRGACVRLLSEDEMAELECFAEPDAKNTRGEVVGSIRAVLALEAR
jgi:hypothetical protein